MSRTMYKTLSMSLRCCYIFLLLISFSSGIDLWAQRSHVMDHNKLQKFMMAKRLYQRGEQLYKKGKADKAVSVFQDCVEMFPDYSHADFYISRIFYEKKQYLQALMYIERAKSHHDAFAALQADSQKQYLDQIKYQIEELEVDIRELKELLYQLPPNPPPMSAAYERKIKLEGAIRDKERTIEILKGKIRKPIADHPMVPADYYYNHGNILFRLKKYNEAFDQFRATIVRDPTYGNAHSNLANLYFMAKKYQLALDHLKRAEKYGAEVNPKFKKALLNALKK